MKRETKRSPVRTKELIAHSKPFAEIRESHFAKRTAILGHPYRGRLREPIREKPSPLFQKLRRNPATSDLRIYIQPPQFTPANQKHTNTQHNKQLKTFNITSRTRSIITLNLTKTMFIIA